MTMRDTADPDEALVRVDAIVGRASEDGWPDQLTDARVDVLRLDQAEAQKSRLRKTTDAGVEVAISLDRGTQLSDGDILLWDETRRAAVVTRVDLKDVLVIDLGGLLGARRRCWLPRAWNWVMRSAINTGRPLSRARASSSRSPSAAR